MSRPATTAVAPHRHRRAGLRALASCLALAAAGGTAHAGCFGVEPPDVRTLPPYCQVKCNPQEKEARSPAWLRWQAIFGHDEWMHTHHYCSGVNFDRKAHLMRNPQQRKFTAGQAYNNYDYVISRWPKTFKLYPEALTRKARLLAFMGKDAEAAVLYENAIAANPKYAPAYAAYSDWQLEHGDRDAAREVLQRGLAQVPGAPLLQSRVQKIGGKAAK